jgi:tRNA(adenine34) deaminase
MVGNYYALNRFQLQLRPIKKGKEMKNNNLSTSEVELVYFEEAIRLAKEAEVQKNLPVGAVITLDGKIIAEGKSAIWNPEYSLTRHAEMEALLNVPGNLWVHAEEMTLYTTLEPCLMCMGAILLHQIGRVLYGSTDSYGGAGTVINHLPTYFKDQYEKTDWEGPAYPEGCDPLFTRLTSIEKTKKSRDSNMKTSSSGYIDH